MTLLEIDADIHRKISENENYVRYSYFELRVKLNLSEDEAKTFIKLVKNKLENMNYKVYLKGERFIFQNADRIVEENEYLIAIKETYNSLT